MRWAIASLMLVIVASFCFVLFIIFNWAIYNTDNGIFTILDGFAQQDFNRYYRQWWDGINNNIAFGFGLSRVVCMGLALICYLVDVFGSQRKAYAE